MSVTIFYILPYLTSPHFEKLRHERIYRERQIVLQSRKLGYKSDLLLPTFGSKEVVLPDDCGSRLYPVSNHRTGNKFNYISMSLLERIEQDKPDLVVFKGMGYRLGRWLVLNCKHRQKIFWLHMQILSLRKPNNR